MGRGSWTRLTIVGVDHLPLIGIAHAGIAPLHSVNSLDCRNKFSQPSPLGFGESFDRQSQLIRVHVKWMTVYEAPEPEPPVAAIGVPLAIDRELDRIEVERICPLKTLFTFMVQVPPEEIEMVSPTT